MQALIQKWVPVVPALLIIALLARTVLHHQLLPKVTLPVLAVLVVFTLLRPRAGLYMTVAALPLLSWVRHVFQLAYFIPAELLTYSFLAGWLLYRIRNPHLPWRTTPLNRLLPLWVCVVLASVFVELKALPLAAALHLLVQRGPDLFTFYPVDSPLYSLRSGATLLVGLIPFALVAQEITTEQARRRLIHVILGIGSLVGAYAVFQYFSEFHLYEGSYVQATLSDRNNLGAYLSLILGLGVGHWIGADRITKRLLGPALLVVLAGLVCTESRSALAAAAFVFVALAFGQVAALPAQKRRRAAVACVGGMGLLLTILVLTPRFIEWKHVKRTVLNRVWVTFDPDRSFTEVFDRLPFWVAAGDAFADRPVFGIGVGRFFAAPYIKRRRGVREHAHNSFFQIGAELGSLGLAAFIALLVLWYRVRWRRYRDAPDAAHRWEEYGITLGVTSYLVTWLPGDPLLIVEQQLIFWSVLGVGIAGISMPVGPGRRSWAKAWPWAVAALVLLTVFFRQPLPMS